MMTCPKKITLAFVLMILVSTLTGCSESSDKTSEKRTAKQETVSSEIGKLPKLIDFISANCEPCRRMEPILDSLRIAYQGKIEIITIDTKIDSISAQKYGVTVTPSQIFLDAEDKEKYRHMGFLGAESIATYFKLLGVNQ
ncbi:MAG: thioredoxin family protein [candidate division Zixibacteria bacterium]|nr:thioredoxin family protein [candidate division Zixibacteria bacterium]